MAQKGLWNAGNKYSHSALKAKASSKSLGMGGGKEGAKPMEKPKKVVR